MAKSESDIFFEKISAVIQNPIRKKFSKFEGNKIHHAILIRI